MIDMEVREEARKLIIFKGKTQEEVAGELKLSPRTIANWSAAGNWNDKRKKYLEIIESLEYRTLRLLTAATEKALKTQDKQDIYIVIQLHMCMGNNNNQFFKLRPFIIKDLIDVKNKSLEEVAELFGLKVDRVKKLYRIALDSQSKTADGIN